MSIDRQSGYGDIHASSYDLLFGDRDDTERVAEVLHALADGGEALEFGVGTGRLAIPLARRGTRVHAVDNSEAMHRILAAKLDGEPVVPIRGDFAGVSLEAPVALVYCTFSTLFLLGDQDAQVACLENAARQLVPGGKLLIEAFVHDRTRFQNNQEVRALDVDDERAVFRVATLRPNDQVVRVQRIGLTAEETELMPNRLRFVYPAELNLMARLAGLRPVSRWSDWYGRPFTAYSDYLVATFEKPAGG